MREITIRAVLNGYVVQVGCQQLAYTDRGKLIGDLASYLNDPESTEARILGTEAMNKEFLQPSVPQQQPDCGSANQVGASIGSTLGPGPLRR